MEPAIIQLAKEVMAERAEYVWRLLASGNVRLDPENEPLSVKFARAVVEMADRIAELNQCFDARDESDRRAIKRWQDATGRELVLPDHADLCAWLMERIQKLEGPEN
jgi:hypothetical protein